MELPQTTSVSTATTLIYATGAGIAAAAGTRLALQLIAGGFLTAPPLIYAIGTGIAAAAGTTLAPHARELLL